MGHEKSVGQVGNIFTLMGRSVGRLLHIPRTSEVHKQDYYLFFIRNGASLFVLSDVNGMRSGLPQGHSIDMLRIIAKRAFGTIMRSKPT